MLRVLRVEHLPTAMDGDFDAMGSIHQRKWEEDWEHPLGGKWVDDLTSECAHGGHDERIEEFCDAELRRSC